MIYHPEPESHIRVKFKLVLDLPNYATKKICHDTGVDKPYLAAKKDFISMKAAVDKLDINELVNVPTSLNNLKTKVDNLHVIKLKAATVVFKN